MHSPILAAVLVMAARLASAATPPSFSPGSTHELIVTFHNRPALNGAVLARSAVQTQPQLSTPTRLNGTSYAVLMIDIDVPTNSSPQTSTLLHWMQTGLKPATKPTKSARNNTTAPAYALHIPAPTATPPLAPYLAPDPPPRAPCSHRYVQLLVDTSGLPPAALAGLRAAAAPPRRGAPFDARAVLAAAGLQARVIAGHFFNVTSLASGPAAANGTGSGSGSGTAAAAPAAATATGPASGKGTGMGSGSGSGSGAAGTGTTTTATTAAAPRLGPERRFAAWGVFAVGLLLLV